MPRPDGPETTRPTDQAPAAPEQPGVDVPLTQNDSSGRDEAQRRASDSRDMVGRGTLPDVSLEPTSHQFVSTNFVAPDRAREIAGQFPVLNSAQMTEARQASDGDFGRMRMRSLDGSADTNVDKLIDDPKVALTAEHRDVIRQAAAEVRAHFKQVGGPYQDANWEHTAEEVGHALKIANQMHLSSTETTKLALASLFSDSVKTPQNFFTHHIDGAVGWTAVADRVLKTLPPDQREVIKRDVERAILTHQISPPGFMSNFHARMIREGLKGDLDKAAAARDLSTQEKASLSQIKEKIDDPKKQPFTNEEQELLKKVADDKRELLKAIQDSASIDTLRQKMANPLDSKNHTSRDGLTVLDLDAKETAQLKRLGFDRVWVPHPASPSYKLEIAEIASDSAQYGSMPGKFKYTLLAGPDTPFQQKTLEESWASPENSGREVAAMLNQFPELNQLATEELKSSQTALRESVMPQLKQWVDAQPDVPRNGDNTVPYLDAPLKYPAKLDEKQQAELKDLQGRTGLSAAEQERLYVLTHDGLTPLEVRQLAFAKEIRTQAASMIKQEFQYQQPAENVVPLPEVVSLNRTGARVGGREAARERAPELADSAPADIKTSPGGGFEVAARTGARSIADLKAGEEITEKDIFDLKRQLLADEKTPVGEKKAALMLLDEASKPSGRVARDTVRDALKKAPEGARGSAEGHAGGIGVVALFLAASYAAMKQQKAVESYIPGATVN